MNFGKEENYCRWSYFSQKTSTQLEVFDFIETRFPIIFVNLIFENKSYMVLLLGN